MHITNKDITMNFMGREITIPKGTRLTHRTALGPDSNYNFVDDLSFIDKKQQYPLWHDAHYYGIDVPKEYVTETND